MLKIQESLKDVTVLWEETLLRTFCKKLFLKKLKELPHSLSQEELLAKLEQIEKKTGKHYALTLLSKRALLSTELEKKLLAKGLSCHSAKEIVLYCQEKGYLDDAQLLQRLAARECKRGKSRRFLFCKLQQQKGLGAKEAQGFLQSDSFSEEEALNHWLHKHAKKLKSTDLKARQKVIQTLSRLGFPWELIIKKIPPLERDGLF